MWILGPAYTFVHRWLIMTNLILPNSEYAQTTQDKVDYCAYPSGTRALTANDFFFYNKNSNVPKKLTIHHSS
jgi:hypothetical protein